MTTDRTTANESFSLRAIGRAAGPVVIAGFVGQLFSIFRTIFVAARIGTAPALDALLVSLVFPVVVSGLLVSSLRTAIVPAYVEIARKDDDLAARNFVGAVITWIGLLGFGATVLLILVPAAAVDLSGPGLDQTYRALAIRFLPFVAPILVFTALSTMLGALCQVSGRFAPIAVGLVIAPLASLIVTVGLWNQLGIDALAFGLVVGAAVSLGVMFTYLARSRLLPPLAFRADRRHVTGFLSHAAPLTAGSAILQFNLLADRALATLLSSGAVSALFFAGQIVLQPLNSITFAWQMVAYPSLVRAAQSGERGSLGSSAARALRITIVVFVPIAVAAAALAPLGVDIVFRRGAFGDRAVGTTASVAAAFAPLLLGLMVQPILTGAHNARRHGALLALVAGANALLNVVLNVALGLTLGVAGIALSTSLTVTVLLFYLARRLSITEEGFAVFPLLGVGGRALVASLIPGVPVGFVAWVWLPPMPILAAASVLAGLLIVGLGGYVIAARLISLDEPWIIVKVVVQRCRLLVR